MGVIEDVGSGPVALDAAPFIYLIEEHPQYLPIVRPVFAAIAAGQVAAVASVLTLLEALVQPSRVGDAVLAERYEAFLARSRGLRLHEVTRPIARAAAHLRAVHNIRTPDAVQLATALVAGCSAFLTNDKDLPAVSGIRILCVKVYLSTT